ncbi:MAG: hypothetical protein IH586_20235 [Anaerolineaceae bacterium]|nr:hypothetical protein [Anaerolineaceae bacterium]
MKLNSFSLAALILTLLFGGIGFSTAMNWWQTETNKVPVTYTEGEAAGEYNPADIRGSYTFGDVSQLFAIPLSDLQAAFRIPADADPATYPLKSLESLFADLPVEMGTGSVRMFVAFYKGLPYELAPDEETYLFPEAAAILKAQDRLRPEQASYLDGHLIQETPAVDVPAAAPIDEPAPLPTEHVAPDMTLTGKTTFQELLDWGISPETIEEILGEKMPAPQTVIKDFLTQKGLEFSSYKTKLQVEVDKQK